MRILSHAELDRARQVGDPPADATALALGKDAWMVNAMLRHVHKNGEALPDGIPPIVCAFFDEHVKPPSWFDEARAMRAQEWATRHLFHITVALFCASLPTAYGAAKGARVLASTGRMQGAKLDRRVNETAQFVLDIVAEGGLGREGSTLRAIQKVRLMHAAVRNHLLEKGFGQGEIPINQEDLLGTLFTFSVVVIRALRRLGLSVGDEEAEDFYQLWRGVGVMLGIAEELVPVDFASACDLAERINVRQVASSEQGRALMEALLAGIEQHVGGLGFAPRYLIRYLIGDELADLLNVPRDNGFQTKLTVLRLLPRLPGKPLATATLGLSQRIGRPILEGIIAAKLRGEPPAFAMPLLREAEQQGRIFDGA